MKQTTKTVLVLLALVVGAAGIGYAALWAGKDETRKAEAKERREKLFDFDKSRVKRLRLSRNGQLVAELEKADERWKLEAPSKADADGSAVEGILASLLAMKEKRELPDEKNASAFGLENPAAEVAITLDDGRALGLQVGIDNRFDNTLYVRKTGEATIHSVDAFSRPSLDKTAFDLRDKSVAHVDDVAEPRTIEVTAVKAPYTLSKDGTAWKVNGAPADEGTAESVWSAIRRLRATAVAAEGGASLSTFGLAEPKAVVRVSALSGKDSFSRTLLVGQAGAEPVAVKTYAKRDDSPIVYEVDQQILADLDKEPFELANKELVHLDRDAIRKVVLESPAGGRIEIVRTASSPSDGGDADEVFTVVSPSHGAAKREKLSSVLDSLVGMRASAFYGPVPVGSEVARYGLDRPKTVTLLGEGGKVLARVRFGGERDGKRFALSDTFDKLAGVERGPVDGYPWNVADALETPSRASR